jgi:hypothetical protein
VANIWSDQIMVHVGTFTPGTSTTQVSVTLAAAALDKTVFLNKAERVHPGIRSDEMAWSGLFEDGTDGTGTGNIDDLMGKIVGTIELVTYAFGTALGARAYVGTSFIASAGVSGNVLEMVRAEAGFKPDGTLSAGKHHGSVFVGTHGTRTGSIDNAATSTGTSKWYSHIMNFSGSMNLEFQDSADGTSFANIGISDASTAGGRTSVVAIASTLRRYTRVTINGSHATTTGTIFVTVVRYA